MKLFTIIFVIVTAASCKGRTDTSETSAGTKTIDNVTYLFEIGDKQPRLLFRSQCEGDSPYTLEKCSKGKQAREWDVLKDKIDQELTLEINVLIKELAYLQSQNLAQNEQTPERKLLYSEQQRKTKEKLELDRERQKLVALEKAFSIPASTAILSLDENGNPNTLQTVLAKLFQSSTPKENLVDGRAFTRFLKYFENTGFIENEKLPLPILALYRTVKVTFSKQLGSMDFKDINGKKVFIADGTINVKAAYPKENFIPIEWTDYVRAGYFTDFTPKWVSFSYFDVTDGTTARSLKEMSIYMGPGEREGGFYVKLPFSQGLSIRTLQDLKSFIGQHFMISFENVEAAKK